MSLRYCLYNLLANQQILMISPFIPAAHCAAGIKGTYTLCRIIVVANFCILLVDCLLDVQICKLIFDSHFLRYETLEDLPQAIEWLMQLISVSPTDPQALAKLGDLYDSEGDKSQAFQYYYEVLNSNRNTETSCTGCQCITIKQMVSE